MTKGIKKFFLFVSVLLLSLCCLPACKTEAFEGEICKLEYKEAYSIITTTLIPTYNGMFVSTMVIPVVRTYPDRWYVQVREYDEEAQTFIYHECYVTEEVFNTLKIGDWFVYNEEYCSAEEPYTDERI